MDVNQFISAANAIYNRQMYFRQFGREDIHLFASLARDVLCGRTPRDRVSEHRDWKLWQARVEEQIKLEAAFPFGLRIGSFVRSPVSVLSDILHDRPIGVRIDECSILKWVRARTWIAEDADSEFEQATGISVPDVTRLIAQLFDANPVLFFLILCDESELAAAMPDQPRYPARLARASKKRWRFHADRPLLDVTDALAEWHRVVALGDYVHALSDYNHEGFRYAVTKAHTINFMHLRSGYHDIFDTHLLSVPSLRVRMDGHAHSSRLGLAEFDRVVTPDIYSGHSKREPMHHFYGLDHVDVAMVGLLELICWGRGIPSVDGTAATRYGRKQARLWFGGERLKVLTQSIFSRWWPHHEPVGA